jgi:threonine synthase
MNIAGKTPLLRAKKLEQELGVKEIYLKLEGANPFGNKFDRIAEVLVKDALMQNKKIIFVDGSQDYINSVSQFALRNDVNIKIPLFKNERWKRSKFSEEQIINMTEEVFENKVSFLENFCIEKGYYYGSNGYNNKHLSSLALEKIGDEIATRLHGDISTVFTQLSYGHTVSSLYNGFVRKWVQGEINKYPKIFSGTIPKGNVIFDDYKKKFPVRRA